jgi:hypothetical protein
MTERVLNRLGRPRLLWVLLWAAVPLLSPIVFATRSGCPGAGWARPSSSISWPHRRFSALEF